jgi:hypothetical protein
MNTKALLLTVMLGASLSTACQFYARDAKGYKKATRDLLDTKSAEIKACYENAKQANGKAKGTVVVHFLLEAKTGRILAPEVLPESTAPKELGECVVKSINGLVLNPPDQRLGDATFAYDFQDG